MQQEVEDQIIQAAQCGYDHIHFYKRLCRQRPQAINDVPFISYVDYHHANGLMECINPAVEPYGVLPPFHRDFRRLPYTILESNHDIDRRQERLALAIADSPLAKKSRVLMVTNEANGPFACDLSTGLGWEGIAASIYYHVGSDDDLFFQLAAHNADAVIWCLERSALPSLTDYTSAVLYVHHLDQPVPAYDGPMWLFSDEFNLIASRPRDREEFMICEDQLLIESDSSGRQYMTSLNRELFPLVRYRIPNSFEVKQ